MACLCGCGAGTGTAAALVSSVSRCPGGSRTTARITPSSGSARQALLPPWLRPILFLGENIILLASARLRTYLPWTSAALIRPSANRGWAWRQFLPEQYLSRNPSQAPPPRQPGRLRTWPGWTTGRCWASCGCRRGPASSGRRRAICWSAVTRAWSGPACDRTCTVRAGGGPDAGGIYRPAEGHRQFRSGLLPQPGHVRAAVHQRRAQAAFPRQALAGPCQAPGPGTGPGSP